MKLYTYVYRHYNYMVCRMPRSRFCNQMKIKSHKSESSNKAKWYFVPASPSSSFEIPQWNFTYAVYAQPLYDVSRATLRSLWPRSTSLLKVSGQIQRQTSVSMNVVAGAFMSFRHNSSFRVWFVLVLIISYFYYNVYFTLSESWLGSFLPSRDSPRTMCIWTFDFSFTIWNSRSDLYNPATITESNRKSPRAFPFYFWRTPRVYQAIVDMFGGIPGLSHICSTPLDVQTYYINNSWKHYIAVMSYTSNNTYICHQLHANRLQKAVMNPNRWHAGNYVTNLRSYLY